MNYLNIMNLLLAHLWGDYILQNHWMAVNKTTKSSICLIHCVLYTLPFLFLTLNIKVLFIICFSHFIIDRFKLALYLVKIKNYCFTEKGFPINTPDFLSIWLIILVDNTLHLTINFFALKL